jgi:hypothetical protein
MEVKAKRQTLLSKAKWLEMGANNSADFWNLGKTTVEDHNIYGLQTKNGKVKKRSKKMLQIARDYYNELYIERPTDPDSQNELLQKLPQGNFDNTTGPVSREEVDAVIHHWDNGTVPGLGGIPYDFFKQYAEVGLPDFDLTEGIQMVMTILIQPLIYNVMIPKKWTTGIIKLLYKKGDQTDIKNYRPLTMTESMYKLFTSIINNRLLKPFPPV